MGKHKWQTIDMYAGNFNGIITELCKYRCTYCATETALPESQTPEENGCKEDPSEKKVIELTSREPDYTPKTAVGKACTARRRTDNYKRCIRGR